MDTIQLWRMLDQIKDPELPMVSIVELGIVRDVKYQDGEASITITPTFSGCPAMADIELSVQAQLKELGIKRVHIVKQLSPPWQSTDISGQAIQKLEENGIVVADKAVHCPQCDSKDIVTMSAYGATSCKSFARCMNCQEPFEVFRSIKLELQTADE